MIIVEACLVGEVLDRLRRAPHDSGVEEGESTRPDHADADAAWADNAAIVRLEHCGGIGIRPGSSAA